MHGVRLKTGDRVENKIISIPEIKAKDRARKIESLYITVQNVIEREYLGAEEYESDVVSLALIKLLKLNLPFNLGSDDAGVGFSILEKLDEYVRQVGSR